MASRPESPAVVPGRAPPPAGPASALASARPYLVAAAVFALATGLGAVLIGQAEAIERAAQRAAALNVASDAGYALEQQLARSLSATYAMAAMIRREGDIAGFASLAAELLPLHPGASSLVLAPGGVVREIWPPAKGVVGLNLLTEASRSAEARAAIESRQLSVGGPSELKQGGLGLVGRLPVFVSDGRGDRFWGFANVVVRLPDLLAASGTPRLAEAGYEWALSRVTAAGGAEVTFAGSLASPPPQPVTMDVTVPNGRWTLSIAPRGGWRPSPLRRMGYPVTLALATLLGFLAFRVWRVPDLLRREVAARTGDLAAANRALAADIAERERAEEALRLTQFAVDHASEAIAWSDEAGAIRYLNDAAARLMGRSRAEALGLKIWELDPTMSEQAWQAACDETARTGSLKLTATWPRPPPAGALDVEFTLTRLALGDQRLNMSFMRDVTEQRRAEEQLRQAEKMEAIGQLAGGVAHDFNNLLTGILGYASLLVESGAPGSLAAEAGVSIAEAGERAASLTRQLLGLAQRGKLLNAPVDVHAIIGEVVRFLARTLGRTIVLQQDLGAPHAVVVGDAGQLHQVLLNLAVNARDAMKGGGVLTFGTREVAVGAGEALPPGRYLAISVRDTGVGIRREIRERIFEPFFTTKPKGEGTGLGLATAYGITRNHGGALSVESEPGSGSTFTVRLPLAGDARVAARAEQREAVPHGEARVLVVDDEPGVRAVTSRMLRELGYEPLTAAGGQEALDTYRAAARPIDLVLLDLSMPGMDGQACLRALRELDPGVRVVVTSGYALDGRAQELLDEGAADFVQKPFQCRGLAEALERTLRSPRAMPRA